MPFFSVIIPLYNKEKFIEATLKSVLIQSFTDFEILIINDGSTDKSAEKIIEFKDSRIRYFSKENGGASSARNYGLEKTQTNYITFIDADDYWYPNFLEEMHHNIHRFPEQKVFSAAIEIETSKKVIPAVYSIKKTNNFKIVNYFTASLKESVVWTSCAVFEKSVFEKIGVFDTNLKSGQDTDLWIRIGLVYPILFNWKILARYVNDYTSLSKQSELYLEKLNFTKFSEKEIAQPELKKFLDLNRYAFALKCKLNDDKLNFDKFYAAIDLHKLPIKKRILIQLPASILNKLIELNLLLVQIGLSNSVFK